MNKIFHIIRLLIFFISYVQSENEINEVSIKTAICAIAIIHL
jgi:hypothetical protein